MLREPGSPALETINEQRDWNTMETFMGIRSIIMAVIGFIICLAVAGLGLYLLDGRREGAFRKNLRPAAA